MKNDHPDVKFGKTGVLLINLGTPDSTSWWDIRKYLKEFLSDRRVIEVNPDKIKFVIDSWKFTRNIKQKDLLIQNIFQLAPL